MEQERRAIDFDALEVREDGEAKTKMIRGHGAVYNKRSLDLGGFVEVFEAGAFSESIAKDDIVSLRDHQPSYILGRTTAKTLTLSEDSKGVLYEVTPGDTSYTRDLIVSIERRDIKGGSIIFSVEDKKDERWTVDGDDVEPVNAFMAMWDDKKHKVERHVLKARLFDIGPVTFPAYPQTDVKMRSIVAVIQQGLSPQIARMLESLTPEERAIWKECQSKLDGRGAHDVGRVARLAQLQHRFK